MTDFYLRKDVPGKVLEALLVSNYASLLRFIRVRGGGDDAEDIVQDLWLKAHEANARTEGAGKVDEPLAYLRRMASNMISDNRRAGLRRSVREHSWMQCQGTDESPYNNAPCTERTLIAKEELLAIDRRLDRLGRRSSVIFRRFRIDGATQQEIAAERGISVSGVEKHLSRCYRALAKMHETERGICRR